LPSLAGRLSLVQLAALLPLTRLLISCDSGPAHLAAALGVKTVVLFGGGEAATGPSRWGPWGGGHAVIWKPAMELISVEDVLEAARAQCGARR
jgi:ADP-heptose:LPS heptosyltransferase